MGSAPGAAASVGAGEDAGTEGVDGALGPVSTPGDTTDDESDARFRPGATAGIEVGGITGQRP